MKKTISCILSVVLVMQSFLFVGCEKAEESIPVVETERVVLSTLSTDACTLPKETVPETTAIKEPSGHFYAVTQGENGLVFPCLIENDEDKIYTLESLDAVYYAEDKPIETAVYSSKELASFTWGTDPSLDLKPADALLQTVPCDLTADDFEWAELSFTLLDSQGQKTVRSFFFTTKAENVNASFVEDGETWEYPIFEDGKYWSFRYVITNVIPRDITLVAVYSVDYLDGIPVATRDIEEKDFGRFQLTSVKSLSPGESAGWSEGFGTEYMRDGLTSIKKTFVYRDSEGQLYTHVFRFVLDEQMASENNTMNYDVWHPAAIQGEQWVFDMMLTNDTPDTLILDTVWYTECVDHFFSSSWHEENVSDLVLRSGDSFHWKHHEDLDWPKYNQKVFSCVFHNTAGEQVIQSFRFSLNKDLAPILPVADEHDYNRYSTIIDFYDIPAGLGKPMYTAGEIQQMIDAELTLDEIAEKISTYPDLVQYLYLKNFSTLSVPDSNFWFGGYQWQCSRSAQDAFDRNGGGCGERANLCNYILQGDYDEQGYILDVANEGGHIFNYFKENGVYYFSDIGTIMAGGNYDNAFYRIYATENPIAFAENRIRDNHTYTSDDYYSHIVMLYMYPSERPVCPNGFNGGPANVLPSEVQDIATILYMKEDRYAPIYVDGISKDLLPVEAQ